MHPLAQLLRPLPAIAAGVVFVRAPRVEPYGRVAVFLDVAGNRWDLLSRVAGT